MGKPEASPGLYMPRTVRNTPRIIHVTRKGAQNCRESLQSSRRPGIKKSVYEV